ncbi:homoserine kinase [Fusobacterium sp. MFO224]|uniref:homoserine kinase n=1 Tax=Fusobacterium sp. MFO224 TaxID=3378070 RepID=UPI003851869A
MIKIKVPATTANIGPGFDSLGLAFKLYSYFSFEEIEEGLEITGCEEEYRNEENLVYTSFKKTLEKLNATVKGVRIKIESNIPVSRGLGSSAACIIGGVMGANEISGGELSKMEIFNICNEIEGHPDNISPALFGGLTASLVADEVPYFTKYKVSEDLSFCALIPGFKLSTQEARKVLPNIVLYNQATHNISRTAVLLKSLEEGNRSLIKIALEDKLHEPYRKSLIDEYNEVREICENNNVIGFFISGAGPTLMGIVDKNLNKFNLEKEISNLKNNWAIKKLDVDLEGALVL